MFNSNKKQHFMVRTRAYPRFPEIVGKILYIRDVDDKFITFSFTEDCVPQKDVYNIPADINDDGWYDVTDLVLRANAIIRPAYSSCVFMNDSASKYRNHLGLELQPLTLANAVNKVCILGDATPRGITFLKQAYFVAVYDKNGYILAYSGYCQPAQWWTKPKIQQKILNLNGTNRSFFPAAQIVGACNAAYTEDTTTANKLVSTLNDRVASVSTDTNAGADIFSSDLKRMRLGATPAV